MSKPTHKRNDLSLVDKYEAIKLLDKGQKQTEVCKILNISQAQVSRINSKKEEIRKAVESNANPKCKRIVTGKDAEVEKALAEWYTNAIQQGIPISGPILSEKAKECAKQMNKTEFQPTNGWLQRWKKRNNIVYKKTITNEAKKSSESKKTTNETPEKTQESSDSEDEMFAKKDKEETGIPTFIKGTTWPLDTSVEVVVTYDAAKEIRTVRKEFFPLLFHMTRSDPRQMSNYICRSKVLLSFIRTRMDNQQVFKKKNKHYLKKELKSLNLEISPDSPKKIRNSVTSSALSSSITDITEAKTELLKLLARVDLKRPDFAQLLLWMQKLKLCGRQGGGRWGEVYVKDTTADEDSSSVDIGDNESEDNEKPRKFAVRGRGRHLQKQSQNSDSENEEKSSKFEASRKNRCKIGIISNFRGRGRGGKFLRGKKSETKNWNTALRHIKKSKPQDESAELFTKKLRSKSPMSTARTSSSRTYDTRKKKLHTGDLKGESTCKTEVENKDEKPANNTKDKCFIPLVDVVSVLDKRIMDKKKSGDQKSHHWKSKKNKRSSENETNVVEQEIENEEEFVPNKKYRLSSGSSTATSTEFPVPICLFKAEDMSEPFVEIDNVENGVCVPYEDRFVAKEAEVEKNIMQQLEETHSDENNHADTNSTSSDTQRVKSAVSNKRKKHKQTLSSSVLDDSDVPPLPYNKQNVEQNRTKNTENTQATLNNACTSNKMSSEDQSTNRSKRHKLIPLNSILHKKNHSTVSEVMPASTSASISIKKWETTRSSDVPPVTQKFLSLQKIKASTREEKEQSESSFEPDSGELVSSNTDKHTKQSLLNSVRLFTLSDLCEMSSPIGIDSISDGATLNLSMQPVSSVCQYEPTSSTNEKIPLSKNLTVKPEQTDDFVVVKNEECVISLNSDDEDEQTEATSTIVRMSPNSNIDNQKEADPIIVIDD